jgi:hypothetical protein
MAETTMKQTARRMRQDIARLQSMSFQKWRKTEGRLAGSKCAQSGKPDTRDFTFEVGLR